jgi:hypothetical protein
MLALCRFQHDNGIPISGMYDARTEAKLRAVSRACCCYCCHR